MLECQHQKGNDYSLCHLMCAHTVIKMVATGLDCTKKELHSVIHLLITDGMNSNEILLTSF